MAAREEPEHRTLSAIWLIPLVPSSSRGAMATESVSAHHPPSPAGGRHEFTGQFLQKRRPPPPQSSASGSCPAAQHPGRQQAQVHASREPSGKTACLRAGTPLICPSRNPGPQGSLGSLLGSPELHSVGVTARPPRSLSGRRCTPFPARGPPSKGRPSPMGGLFAHGLGADSLQGSMHPTPLMTPRADRPGLLVRVGGWGVPLPCSHWVTCTAVAWKPGDGLTRGVWRPRPEWGKVRSGNGIDSGGWGVGAPLG